MFKSLMKKKKGQAMIEMVCVLGLYLFLIGFMISGFQLMYNKMVYSMAAYEGVRTAIAYNPTKGGYDLTTAKARARDMIQNQIGNTAGPVKVDIISDGDYYKCTVTANVKFLFPIINPDGIGSKTQHTVSTTFAMRKERP